MSVPTSGNLWCNGRPVLLDDIVHAREVPQDAFEASLFNFTRLWLSGTGQFQVPTSGSTGAPRVITHSRGRMIASARRTIDAFALRPGQTALLCLNPDFIAGQMMIVRSLLSGLSMIAVTPSSDPMSYVPQTIDFTAMVPLQVHDLILRDKQAFNRLGTVIIGGGAVDPADVALMQSLPSRLYATYGMTETVSHVALRQLNGAGASPDFRALPGVHFTLDSRGCLVIHLQEEADAVVTNDLARLISATEFGWLGRWDNVINSGGVKIIPEALEETISAVLTSAGITCRFFISGLPDPRLGQKVVLVMEISPSDFDCGNVQVLLKSSLPPYQYPRGILACPRFRETATGKVDRLSTLGLAISVCGSSD